MLLNVLKKLYIKKLFQNENERVHCATFFETNFNFSGSLLDKKLPYTCNLEFCHFLSSASVPETLDWKS